AVIHRGEPLQRTPQSKPHVCEELVRLGGELVYLIGTRAYNQEDFNRAVKFNPRMRSYVRGTRMRNPEMYARGSVRHADHATIRLEGWHRVMINAEITTSNLAYLD
ncbi:MAG: hypothetical protein PHQ19_00150, partial [Candidatus Krumholzibacteria bacterium]|nr:hypothetical protein [Candidatus Krumholzibacteria bacterium]